MADSAQPSDFGRFYRTTVSSLRRFLARMVRSEQDAEDLAHDAYWRMYQALDRQQIRQPEAFLFTTARRLALQQLRRARIAPARALGETVVDRASATGPGVEQIVMARQEWAQVEEAIAALPSGCRTVLQLSHRDGLSHAAIAAQLGIAISTVEKQHARALRLIRRHLADANATVGHPPSQTRARP